MKNCLPNKQTITMLIQKNWIPTIKSKVNINQIFNHFQYIQYQEQQILFYQGDHITEFVFLIEGIVNCYRHKQSVKRENNSNIGQFIKQYGQPKAIMQSIYSHNQIRYATCKAQQNVRCCKINALTLKKICSQIINQNQQIQKIFSDYLNIKLHSIKRYELIKFVKYRKFPLRTKVIEKNSSDNTITFDSIFFILEGQCRVSTNNLNLKNPLLSKSMIGNKIHQLGLINLCKHEVIGLQILFEYQYKYNYIVTTQLLEVLEINKSNLNNFPAQFKTKLQESYIRLKQLVNYRLIQQGRSLKQNKTLELGYQGSISVDFKREFSKIQKKQLKQLCMYVPRNVSCNYVIKQNKIPESIFIPKRKQKKQINVKMIRHEWSNYLKLPRINPIIQNE